MANPRYSRESLTLTARVLGNKFGAEVIFANMPTGATDGRRVYLNAHFINVVDDWARDIVRGLIDHEVVGHCLHTDFSWRPPQGAKKLTFNVCQVLEDIRIESAAQKVLPGVHINLGRCVESMCANTSIFGPDNAASILANGVSPTAAVCNLLLNAGRSLISLAQRDALRSRAKIWTDIATTMFGAQAVTRIMDVAEKARKANSTAEIWTLATEVEHILKDVAEPPPPPKQQKPKKQSKKSRQQQGSDPQQPGDPSQAQSQDSGDDSSGDDDGDDAGDDAGDSDGQDQDAGQQQGASGGDQGDQQQAAGGSDSSDGAGQQDGDAAAKGSQGASPDGSDGAGGGASHQAGAPTPEQSSAAQAALDSKEEMDLDLSKAAEKALSKANLNTLNVEDEIGVVSTKRPGQPNVSPERMMQLRTQVAPHLEQLLEAKGRRWSERTLSGRRLDPRGLHRISLRDARIFKRKHEEESVNTAVALLVDGSGSMSARMGNATREISSHEAMQAVTQLLDASDVAFQVSIFGSSLYVAKHFDDPWRPNKGLFASVWGGSTVLYPAMTRTMADLAMREEDRKLLLLLTDGDVESSYAEAVAQLVNDGARRFDVEVATVFIGSPHSNLSSTMTRNGHPAISTSDPDQMGRFVVKAIEQAIA